MERSSKRMVVFHADDLGYTEGVNRGIIRCFSHGVLTSASLMANGEAFEDAVDRLRGEEADGLDVGVHLALTELSPVCPSVKLPGLCEANGRLPGNPYELCMALLRGRVRQSVIRRELDQQIRKILNRNIRPSHLDSHQHIHILPPVRDVVLDLAVQYGIRWVRSPFERYSPPPGTLKASQRHLATFAQRFKGKLTAAFSRSFKRRLAEAGIRTADHFVGFALTGSWSEAAMVQGIERLQPGMTEWMMHPGHCDPDLFQRRTRLTTQRQQEMDLLTSPRIRAMLARKQVELTHFRKEIP